MYHARRNAVMHVRTGEEDDEKLVTGTSRLLVVGVYLEEGEAAVSQGHACMQWSIGSIIGQHVRDRRPRVGDDSSVTGAAVALH